MLPSRVGGKLERSSCASSFESKQAAPGLWSVQHRLIRRKKCFYFSMSQIQSTFQGCLGKYLNRFKEIGFESSIKVQYFHHCPESPHLTDDAADSITQSSISRHSRMRRPSRRIMDVIGVAMGTITSCGRQEKKTRSWWTGLGCVAKHCTINNPAEEWSSRVITFREMRRSERGRELNVRLFKTIDNLTVN